MIPDRLKNAAIGSFILAALAIGVGMILFLKPTIGDGKQLLKVRFANTAGVGKGTRVTFAGRAVGQVAEIKLVSDARNAPADPSGRPFIYELTLKIDSSIPVSTVDEVTIRTAGLMGERSIAILPKTLPQGTSAESAQGHVLYASSGDPFENTFAQLNKTAAKAEETLSNFSAWLVKDGSEIGKAAASFSMAANSIQTISDDFRKQAIVPQLSENMALARSMLAESMAAASNLNRISDDLANGEGCLGKLFKEEDLYLRLNSLLGKSETLMNDINHYGLLFQYDKHWQRSRMKKANALKALDSPGEFRAFFEGEIDSINVSLGRIGELLNKAEDSIEYEKIKQSDSFKQNFEILQRQVQGIGRAVKLYQIDLGTPRESSP